MPEIICGNLIAQECRAKTAEKLAEIKQKTGLTAGLTVIIVGDDPASAVYVRNKEKAAAEAGFNSSVVRLPADTPQEELLKIIDDLNNDDCVDGILVQLPLPAQIDENAVLKAIRADKDVDGFHVENMGALACGFDGIVPCTPKGCLHLLHTVRKDLTGLNALVIGRSNIVGKPMALLLLGENCTVTIAHSKTKNLSEIVKRSDIVVAAVGKPKFVRGDWIKDGAIVIDVGINRQADGKLCGDVDFDAALPHCEAITPVPKGVGPMTIAMLLENTLEAFVRRRVNR